MRNWSPRSAEVIDPSSEESSAANTRAGIRGIPASTSCAAKDSTNLDTASASRALLADSVMRFILSGIHRLP
ncbi:hypothetical protein GCM10023086_21740 [Streptomyces venetus]|uniref:Uncharacterized protein n=1 Tax=Streptomyces venetus TaxID=1701086 RepID=A0ABP8FID5_9ACTN